MDGRYAPKREALPATTVKDVRSSSESIGVVRNMLMTRKHIQVRQHL
jgi:hypothetical protein